MNTVIFQAFSLQVTVWELVGYLGLALFSARWIVQVWSSRARAQSVLPLSFWYMSITGSTLLLVYFSLGHKDLVGFLSNVPPLGIALYNLGFYRVKRMQGIK